MKRRRHRLTQAEDVYEDIENIRMNKNQQTPPLALSWCIWGLGALFYLVAFFQRVAPGVMTQELMQDFNIAATGLGYLSAFYFYPYLAMQIPTGFLADTLGPRKLLTFGCFIAGIGTLLFAVSPGFTGAGIGRLMVGGSVAVAFVGLLKLSSAWFPGRFYGFVAGNALSIGLIGAITAGPPLRLLVDAFHWRWVIGCSGILTLVLGITIWLIVRDQPGQKGYAGFTQASSTSQAVSLAGFKQNMRQVLRYRNTRLLLVIPGGMVGAVLTFSGLWGIPFLVTHFDLTTNQAARLTSCLLIGWAVGGPVFGWLSGQMGKRKPIYIVGGIMSAIGWFVILYVDGLSYYPIASVLALTGFFSGCIITSFPFAGESVSQELSGTVSGMTNMGIMVGPTLLQPLVGIILDRCWDGAMADGVRVYSLEAFRIGFIPMMAWLILSAFLLFFTRETYCRQAA